MLRIRKTLNDAMAHNLMQDFIAKSLLFLKENATKWCEDKDGDQLREFINDMIEFAHEYHIFKEINIQKLMVYKIEHDFAMPLSGYRHLKLCRENFGEDYRMNQFYLALTTNCDYVPVTLDSNIDIMRGS